MSNQPSARTVNLVHFPGKDNDDPRALDEYLDQLQYAVTPAMYGGTKDDPTVNNITAIEAAYAATKNVLLDGIYYVGDGGIELDAAGTIYAISPECGLKATSGLTETTGNGLVNITATGVNVLGMLIDGDDAFRRGIEDSAGGARVEGCEITNIYSTTAAAVGINATATAGGSVYIGNTIHEIESVGDMTTGNENGAARAIRIATTAAVTLPYTVHDNEIYRIIGEEGDGIQVVGFSSPTFYSSGGTVVSENRIRNCSKRGIKIQAHETTVRDNNVILTADLNAGAFAGIDVIDAEDVVVESNRVEVDDAMRGINVSAVNADAAKRVSVIDNRVKTDTSTAYRAISLNEFEDCHVIGNFLEYGHILAANGAKGAIINNSGNDVIATGTTAFIQIASTANQLNVSNNTVLSGDVYAVVGVQSDDNTITGNVRMDGNYRCIHASGASATDNVILNNVGSSTSLEAVTYATVTAADQTYVFGNVNRSGNGFTIWTQHPDNEKDVSTGATSYDWTGIPSSVNEILVHFEATSTDGTSPYTLRIGTSSGIETTGYLSVVASGVATENQSSGWRLTQTGQNASDVVYGVARLSRIAGSAAWICTSNINGPSNVYYICQGFKNLSGDLDRIRLTTTGGTDTFDNGRVSVRWN